MLSETSLEVNNNTEIFSNFKRDRNESIASVSSGSSYSDSSEEVASSSRKSSSALQDIIINAERADCRRARSMSEGAAGRLFRQDSFEVFPSLPDSVLEKMGLLGNGPRERLSEEEMEHKFAALSLAFTIDSATIKDRCERQKRYRNQTETNLNSEIDRLIEKAHRIQPLCVDAETTELLSALLSQIDVVMRAAAHATISSERYGAVQHEDRISESVNVMINHVNLLKQQRDSARRQLQYTKRVLQNNAETVQSPKATIPNGRVITKRRASIATITQPPELTKTSPETRKITRRTSDLSLRASSMSRNARPSRLELGVDLVKIKEGMVENEGLIQEPVDQSDNEESTMQNNSSPVEIETAPLTLRCKLKRKFQRLGKIAEQKYTKWTDDGTMHEVFCFCALMCFSVSLLILTSILLEVEFAKRGLNPAGRFLYWGGGHHTSSLSRKIYHGS